MEDIAKMFNPFICQNVEMVLPVESLCDEIVRLQASKRHHDVEIGDSFKFGVLDQSSVLLDDNNAFTEKVLMNFSPVLAWN